jgi:hypothetical protein
MYTLAEIQRNLANYKDGGGGCEVIAKHDQPEAQARVSLAPRAGD